MKNNKNIKITGISKLLLYVRIAIGVMFHYIFKISPLKYPLFLWRALILLMTFWPDKAVKVPGGYKIHLYLPAYPTRAFFYAIESKLVHSPARPVTIVYSMTRACDFHCPHCYQRRDGGVDVTVEQLQQTAIKLRESGVAMFDIEGGEPFLQFDRLSKLMDVFDASSEVWVNTHGKSVNVEQLLELQKKGLFGIMVSIHSPVAIEHDKFTGVEGSYDAACNAIGMARELGLIVAINSVLTSEQLDHGELDDLMLLAKDLDVQFVQLIHPKPAGKWLTSSKEISQHKKHIEAVRIKHEEYNSKNKKDFPVLAAQVFEERPQGLGCTAGAIDRFYVNAAGEMQPCEFLNLSFGNIIEEGFDNVFGRMRSYFPYPCEDWLCCSQAESIAELVDRYDLSCTPVPWKYTMELVENWDRGKETALYRKIGIYNKPENGER